MSDTYISVLGATGSIGESTLKVISQHPENNHVFALSGYRQIERLAELCHQFQPRYVVVPESQASRLAVLISGLNIDILTGEAGLAFIAQHDKVDVVMAAIVGAAGLRSTLAAAEAGKRILLANKESLVMAGELLMTAAENSGAQILPVDSEHNAIFQSLPQHVLKDAGAQRHRADYHAAGVSHISLTASGGPFRTWSTDEMSKASVTDACKHPNWSMGQKISVDSATLMNKGLELIEACVLFGLSENDIQVVVHPESVIHSAVHYSDGSVLAQLGNPDMCTPIAHVLAWPERIATHVPALDFVTLSQLNFEAPDDVKFPCLALARQAVKKGQYACITINAANEVAVQAFLDERIGFLQIAELNSAMLAQAEHVFCDDIDAVMALDASVRQQAVMWLDAHAPV